MMTDTATNLSNLLTSAFVTGSIMRWHLFGTRNSILCWKVERLVTVACPLDLHGLDRICGSLRLRTRFEGFSVQVGAKVDSRYLVDEAGRDWMTLENKIYLTNVLIRQLTVLKISGKLRKLFQCPTLWDLPSTLEMWFFRNFQSSLIFRSENW